jgi:hypothetical protein
MAQSLGAILYKKKSICSKIEMGELTHTNTEKTWGKKEPFVF